MAVKKKTVHLADDPLWYKDAIIYELHVKSYYDSKGDGIGDFRGLTQKLDYLKSLGITAIWLLPFYPSPQRDDGYDIADYYHVHPQYGTMRDFKTFLHEAHLRGIRVITELVLNHTSDQHEWFKKSRKAKPGSVWRDFYVWSDSPEKYKDARIIFTDFEKSNWSWDAEAKAYYWHRFYSHQPDLNFDNPAVVKAVLKAMDYWFEMGVDGMRLDAVPYLFEREGTNCENLPETYQYLETLRAHVDKKFKDKMLLAEANQWPEDAVAYFGEGNRCHMAFHFPVMPRLFMASWMEDRFPIVDIFEQTPAIPAGCQWALFLRNHDELTLEMVSDEERDYMYRMYARDPAARINVGIRRRLAPLLNNNRGKIELMNILLFSLPGTPVVYYGDEILMGDNHYLGDRNGVRTPMQWSGDRNAGFSRSNPQKLFLPVIIDPDYHYESINVENHERNQSSMLWWMKRVIAMRKRFKAFSRGSIEFLDSDNPKVLAFIRQYEEENILVVVNLSRFSQVVTLDLSRFDGHIPEEVVSSNKFPTITASPYILTLGFYDYYWFSLQKPRIETTGPAQGALPTLSVVGRWQAVVQGKNGERFEREVLPQYLEGCRWFGGKARVMQQVKILDRIQLGADHAAEILVLDVRYSHGANDQYMLPLAFSPDRKAELLEKSPQSVIALVTVGYTEGVLYDGAYDPATRARLFTLIARKQALRGNRGQLVAYPGSALKGKKISSLPVLDSQVIKAEQSNTSLIYGREYFLKMFRRLDEGINPDLEIGRFLTEHSGFPNTPAFAGAVEYRRQGADPIVLAILQRFVPNQGDAWSFTLNATRSYLDKVLAGKHEIGSPPALPSSLLDIAGGDLDPVLQELVGAVYIEMASLLGKRTAELHRALALPTDDSKFAAEPFSLLYQRSLYHSMRTLTRRVFESLRKKSKDLEGLAKSEAEAVVKLENRIIRQFSMLFERKMSSMKIRIHGDYHLGQVLYTGNDFTIIDFEGEPTRSVSERRLKRSPLRDVAGMIRSFHYPAYAILSTNKDFSPEDVQRLEPWAELWYKVVAAVFLKSYVQHTAGSAFMPQEKSELQLMLNAYMLEKAIYEVGYELNNRPDWLVIPLHGIQHLMKDT
jgi:maltose alpha-D-glucosyltransferase/alpha-amylase